MQETGALKLFVDETYNDTNLPFWDADGSQKIDDPVNKFFVADREDDLQFNDEWFDNDHELRSATAQANVLMGGAAKNFLGSENYNAGLVYWDS